MAYTILQFFLGPVTRSVGADYSVVIYDANSL